jgi:hypothetical protein
MKDIHRLRMEEIMKLIPSLVIQSLIATLMGSGMLAEKMQAQSDIAITASISFPFTVGTQRIAPGTYRFRLISPFDLSVMNVKTGDIEMFAVRPEKQRAFEQHGRLIFRSSAGSDVLNEVHFPGADTLSELIQRRGVGRMEAKKSSTTDSASVAQR